jgi:hypothetical protein
MNVVALHAQILHDDHSSMSQIVTLGVDGVSVGERIALESRKGARRPRSCRQLDF